MVRNGSKYISKIKKFRMRDERKKKKEGCEMGEEVMKYKLPVITSHGI